MSQIIIGIHGLGNKPPKRVLEKWWKHSILEGLRSIDRTQLFFNFELVYWADVLHARPLDSNIENKEDPLYLHEPYTPEEKRLSPRKKSLRSRILGYTERHLDRLFLNDDLSLNFSSITDRIIRRYFSGLEAYFAQSVYVKDKGEISARDLIRNKLARALQRHKGSDILLVSHSMGSVIAYDVLTQSVPDINIDTLITIGSPLGLPMVVSKIFSEQKGNKTGPRQVRAPNNVLKYWYNFSDIEDKVAIDRTLNDDYAENIHHVRATDKLVVNNYEINAEKNPHKSFGYLRTREVAEAISQFLGKNFPLKAKNLKYTINGWLYDHGVR